MDTRSSPLRKLLSKVPKGMFDWRWGRVPPSYRTGVNIPGTETEAFNATAKGPVDRISVRQRSRLKAVTATGNYVSSSQQGGVGEEVEIGGTRASKG